MLTPFASGLGEGVRLLAQWHAHWGLEAALDRKGGPDLLDDHLVKLLACVLLEQSILLLADVPRLSAVTLALKGLLWPFRWLHLFLSAPPPPACLGMPLHDAPFPMIVPFSRLPPQWAQAGEGRRPVLSLKDLPPEIVVFELRHGLAEISSELHTTGGLRGAQLRLPGTRHAECRKALGIVKRQFGRGEISAANAAEAACKVLSKEVLFLDELVHSYAEAQFALEKREAPNADTSLSLCERSWRRASNSDEFARWLTSERPALCGIRAASPKGCLNGKTSVKVDEASMAFFRTFSQTQLCLDLLGRRIFHRC